MNLIVHKVNFCILALALCALYACGEEDPVETQEKTIATYIERKLSRNPSLRLVADGSVKYLYLPGDTTTTVASGDSVYFYYAGVLVADTNYCFATNVRSIAEALGLTVDATDNFDVLGVRAGQDNLLEGLRRGLLLTHPYDDGEIIFNSDLGFGDRSNGLIPGNTALIYKIYVAKVVKHS
jgi:hypothetical protein